MALIDPIDPPLGEGDAVLFDMDGTLLFLPVDIDSVRDRLSDFHRGYGLDMAFRPLTDDLSAAASRLEEMARTAHAEGFPDIASWFESLSDAKRARIARLQGDLEDAQGEPE